MFQLLIVDDEPAIVNGIARDIDWELLDISEVRTAYTGKQALEQIRAHRVDIVIADIKMPGLDGLELTGMIRTQWPHVKVILISGYEEFQYAKQAVELGVFSYVTKPFSYPELRDTVAKAILQIHADLQNMGYKEQVTVYMQEHLPIIQERFMIQWLILGQVDPMKLKDSLQQLSIDLNESQPAFMLMLRFDNTLMEQGTGHGEDWSVEAVVMNLAKELLFRNREVLFFEDLDGNVIFIYQGEWEELSSQYRYIQEMAEIFQRAAERTYNGMVSVFWGEKVSSIYELYGSRRILVEMSRRSLVWDTGMIAGPDMELTVSPSQTLTTLDEHPSFDLLVHSYQKEAAIQRIERIFVELTDSPSGLQAKLLSIYFTVAQALIQSTNRRGIQLESWAGDELHHFYNFEGLKSVTTLQSWCINAVSCFVDEMLKQETHHGHFIVEQVKQRLSSDYSKGFKLSECANQLRIHPNYLSRLFKIETGMTITDHLIMIRMEKAMELLTQTGIKVYEIAELVGYESVAHFNRIFKRFTGKSPKEYQESTTMSSKSKES